MKQTYYQKCSVAGCFILGRCNNFPLEKYQNLECLEVIAKLGLNFYLGNTFKYLWRVGVKPESDILGDLRKSLYYLETFLKNKNWFVSFWIGFRYPWVTELKLSLRMAIAELIDGVFEVN
jgi:hypothetical protein